MKSLLACLLAAACLAGGTVQAGSKNKPEAQPAAAAAPGSTEAQVLGEIDAALKDLGAHLRLGPKRLRVNPPQTRAGVELPGRIELVAGKSHDIELPGDAREVVVGNAEVADITLTSRRRIFIIGRKAGFTNVAVLDGAGNTLAQVDVTVGPNTEAVRAAISRQFPDEAIEVAAENGALVLSGTVRSDALAGRVFATARRFVEKDDQVVNLIKVSREQQVLLQVRVSEVQRSILKEIGANTTVNDGARFFSDLNLTATATAAASVNTKAGTLAFSGIRDLIVSLNLLEKRGLVRNLAEPNIVAVSGETAAMLAGGEYPIPVPDDDGIKIEYKPFGVTLSFLPVVLDSGRISLKMTTEVSSLSSEGVTLVLSATTSARVNAFTVRRASSTVELPSGGSLMVAGLIQNDIISGMNGLPGIMDVPILGRLFQSDSFQRNETELVVMVTASLVKPTQPSALVAPTDAISPGGDLDRWLFGKLTGAYSSGFVREGQKVDVQSLRMFGFSIDEFVP